MWNTEFDSVFLWFYNSYSCNPQGNDRHPDVKWHRNSSKIKNHIFLSVIFSIEKTSLYEELNLFRNSIVSPKQEIYFFYQLYNERQFVKCMTLLFCRSTQSKDQPEEQSELTVK